MGKKRKRTRGRDGEVGEEWYGGEEEYVEEEVHEELWEREPHIPLPMRQRDGGVSKQMMVVESVKGKVSTANRNFTDADLERRFQLHEGKSSDGSLMTEEEVLRLLRREKQDRVVPAG